MRQANTPACLIFFLSTLLGISTYWRIGFTSRIGWITTFIHYCCCC